MPHAKTAPIKHCENCGTQMARKRIKGRLEDYGVFLRRRNCSQACANSRRTVQANTHRWRARKIKSRKRCEACTATERLHVHHKDRDPANNAPSNLQVLCASCHLSLHWREDREKRLTAMNSSPKVAVARSMARMRLRSIDGRWCSAAQPQRRPSGGVRVDSGSRHG